MNTNPEEITLERAAVETAVIIKLGLDVHAADIVVCRQDGGQQPKPAWRKSEAELLQWVEQLRAGGAQLYSCYEAGPCGYGLHRRLTALGVVNYVVVPRRWDETGQRVKTDRRDARELCNRLDRYVQGNLDAFSVVRVPTPAQEESRAVARQRGQLVRERQRCVVRGHGLMLSQSIRAEAGWWEPAHWATFKAQLPVALRERVELWQAQAVQLEALAEQWSEKVLAAASGAVVLKGEGRLTAALIAAEVMDWHRFKNRRQPGSYTGMCPSEASTGQSRRQGSITKHGSSRLRHYLVEAVWRMLPWQPDYRPFLPLRTAVGTRARKRAVVAAARRLMVDLWRIHTARFTPEQLGLKRL